MPQWRDSEMQVSRSINDIGDVMHCDCDPSIVSDDGC